MTVIVTLLKVLVFFFPIKLNYHESMDMSSTILLSFTDGACNYSCTTLKYLSSTQNIIEFFCTSLIQFTASNFFIPFYDWYFDVGEIIHFRWAFSFLFFPHLTCRSFFLYSGDFFVHHRTNSAFFVWSLHNSTFTVGFVVVFFYFSKNKL